MYGLFSGLVGGRTGEIIWNPPTAASEENKMTDYCSYIPTAMTVVAQGMQASQHQLIESDSPAHGEGTVQKQAFYQQARTHRGRAKIAALEMTGWGTTASCYVVIMATKGFGVNKMTYAKMGAAAFLTYFHGKRREHYNKYADIVKAIADKLPGKGDCNHITERNCYCAQPETASDAKYCLSMENPQRTLPPGMVPIHCVNGNMKVDPQCQCIAQGNCADRKLQPLLTHPWSGFNAKTKAGTSLRNVTHLLNGQLDPALLNDSSFGQGAFKQALARVELAVPVVKKPLTKAQKKNALALIKTGIPKKIAAQLAQAISGLSTQYPTLAKLTRKRGLRANKPRAVIARPLGKNPFGKRNQLRRNPSRSRKKSKTAQDDLIFFSQQAENRGSITLDSGKNVFDLISHRYQNTGWKKLDFSMP